MTFFYKINKRKHLNVLSFTRYNERVFRTRIDNAELSFNLICEYEVEQGSAFARITEKICPTALYTEQVTHWMRERANSLWTGTRPLCRLLPIKIISACFCVSLRRFLWSGLANCRLIFPFYASTCKGKNNLVSFSRKALWSNVTKKVNSF
jgi:hypothetical protein